MLLRSVLLLAPLLTVASPRVAVFDDALPGQDRNLNGAIVSALSAKGFAVETLNVAGMRNLATNCYAALVVPSCEAVTPSVAAAAVQFVHAGGPTLFTGGPLLDGKVFRRADRWYTQPMVDAEVARQPRGYRPPFLNDAFAEKNWSRSRNGSSTDGSFFRREANGEFHLSTRPLTGWDVFFAPRGVRPYGDGETLFAFDAKSDTPNVKLAVEMIERDGSRWIATPTIGTDWSRVTLAPGDFRYWQDSSAKGRGGANDCFKPAAAYCVGFGFSYSHTPGMGGRAGSVRFRDFASCRDPFAGAAVEKDVPVPEQDGVYPRYKTMRVGDAVCAIPRTRGEGFGRGAIWRFIPLRTVKDDAGGEGAAEWLMLERRPGKPERCLAGFGESAAALKKPETLERLAATVEQMVSGSILFEAGFDRFVYFPGETVMMGASWRGSASRARLEVRDDQGRVMQVAEVANGEKVACKPTGARVLISAMLASSGRPVFSTITSSSAELAPPSPAADFITVSNGEFRLRGRPWHPMGVNFWPLYVAGMNHRDYWAGWMRNEYYAPSLVERDLAHFAEMGGTMISIQAPPLGHERNLLDVLRRCRAHGIYVNLYLPWASPLDFREKECADYLRAARLADNATIVAYDTIWEPGNHVFRDDAARGRWDPAWRAWIDAQYGSVARAERDWCVSARRNAKGEVIGPAAKCFVEDGPWRVMMAAYRRFMDNVTSRAWNNATRRLRALDPNHLISFRQGNTLPYDFALTGPVRHIDFICPEGYAVPDTDAGEDAIGWITRYVMATTGGKPVVWSEFGRNTWDATRMESSPIIIASQGAYSERFYRAGLRAGAKGAVPWWWPGGYRVGERSDYGIIAPSGAERPAARLTRTYAPRFRAAAAPVPDEWMDFDRDAHAGGYCRAAFHEGAAAYGAAQKKGRMLGVRLDGTGFDSGNCPLVAVGNVPCDGTNPPKHLDAEFDAWSTTRAGDRIEIRARLGNVGAAAWLPGSVQQGGCALVARDGTGKEIACAPLHARVGRLGATEELTLSVPAAAGRVRVRLEARGRCPFGDVKTVDAEKVK